MTNDAWIIVVSSVLVRKNGERREVTGGTQPLPLPRCGT